MELVDTIKLQKKKHAETADIEDGDQEPLLEVSQSHLSRKTAIACPLVMLSDKPSCHMCWHWGLKHESESIFESN